MRQEDFYSGEPITGSPANFSPYDEAVNNASFGKYYYDVQLSTIDGEVFTLIGPCEFILMEEITYD